PYLPRDPVCVQPSSERFAFRISTHRRVAHPRLRGSTFGHIGALPFGNWVLALTKPTANIAYGPLGRPGRGGDGAVRRFRMRVKKRCDPSARRYRIDWSLPAIPTGPKRRLLATSSLSYFGNRVSRQPTSLSELAIRASRRGPQNL